MSSVHRPLRAVRTPKPPQKLGTFAMGARALEDRVDGVETEQEKLERRLDKTEEKYKAEEWRKETRLLKDRMTKLEADSTLRKENSQLKEAVAQLETRQKDHADQLEAVSTRNLKLEDKLVTQQRQIDSIVAWRDREQARRRSRSPRLRAKHEQSPLPANAPRGTSVNTIFG